MKSQYKFPLKFRYKPDHTFPVETKLGVYEFVLNKAGVVVALKVTCECPQEYWPTLNRDGEQSYRLELTNPVRMLIDAELDGIEALCSMWGWEYLDRENYELTYIPESPVEAMALEVNDIRHSVSGIKDEQIEASRFGYLAQAIICASKGEGLVTIASFLRRGTADLKKKHYISAIYYFYFILETLYGDGKFRGNEVVKIFSKSAELREMFESCFDGTHNEFLPDAIIKKIRSHKVYSQLDMESFMDHIVKLRGRLHHHSEKNPAVWHPERQEDYALDAEMLHHLVYKVVAHRTTEHVCNVDVARQFLLQAEAAGFKARMEDANE